MRFKAIRRFQLFTLVLCGIAAVSVVTKAQTPAKGSVDVHFTATTDNVSGSGETVKINLFGWSNDADRDQLLAAWTLAPAPGAAARGGGARGAGAAGGRGGARGGRGAAAAAAPDPAADDAVAADDADVAAAGRGGRAARGRGGAAAPAAAQTPESSLTAALQKPASIGILWTSETTGYSIKYAYRLPQPDGGERIILATDRRLGAWSNLWKPAGSAKPNEYGFSIIELRLPPKGDGEGKVSLVGKVAADTGAKTIALDGYATLPVILKSVKRQNKE